MRLFCSQKTIGSSPVIGKRIEIIGKREEPGEKSWKSVRAKNNKGGKGSKVKSQQKLKG